MASYGLLLKLYTNKIHNNPRKLPKNHLNQHCTKQNDTYQLDEMQLVRCEGKLKQCCCCRLMKVLYIDEVIMLLKYPRLVDLPAIMQKRPAR